MEKLVYLLWKRPDLSDGELKAELLGDGAKRLVEGGAGRLALNVADEDVAHAASARRTRLAPPPAGLVSFWLDCADDRGPCERVLSRAAARLAGYLVVESVPLPNTSCVAPPGERTPGVNMVSCIERPEWISWDDWIERWHGAHKRVALETQCTFAYVRNTVVRPLTADAPPWAGIVEEGFPAEAVTDPMLWYRTEGSREVLERNLRRMLESCRAFLDLERVESHPMSEYRLAE